ncbi:MAG: pantetheine-phosphate adenylyltransferase [archaeon]|nr:pantetheine-phosphate adenylyltransferase [archaeon]
MKAVYPGTFDPLTKGHLDVIKRAVRLFGFVVVAVAKNPAKKPLFSSKQRAQMVKNAVEGISGVEVVEFSSLLVEFAKGAGAKVIIRGLRETSDFSHEFQHAIVNRELDSSIETVFVMTSPEYFYVTSSIVKEIAAYGGDYSKLVPAPVALMLAKKFRK